VSREEAASDAARRRVDFLVVAMAILVVGQSGRPQPA